MAEENESQEKTEDPSQRKLEQAKEDGKVLTSKEMYVFTSLFMAFIFMSIISLFIKPYITEWSKLFQFDKHTLDHFSSIRQIQLSKLNESYFFIFKITLLVGIPLFLTVCFTQTAVGGINFSTKAVMPKANKLDPIKGMKKIHYSDHYNGGTNHMLSVGFKLNRNLYTHDIEGCPQLIDSVYLTPISKDPYNPYEIMCERNLGKYTHPKLVKIMAKAEKSNKWYKNRIGPTCNWRNWTNKFDWFGPMN